MNIDDIRQKIRDGLSGPMEEICLHILDALVKRPPDQLERLSYPMFGRWAEKRPGDVVLQSAITILSQMENHPIELYFLFLDQAEGREVEIQIDEIKAALAEDMFIDPQTGEKVENFRDLIIPMFRATNEFKETLLEKG